MTDGKSRKHGAPKGQHRWLSSGWYNFCHNFIISSQIIPASQVVQLIASAGPISRCKVGSFLSSCLYLSTFFFPTVLLLPIVLNMSRIWHVPRQVGQFFGSQSCWSKIRLSFDATKISIYVIFKPFLPPKKMWSWVKNPQINIGRLSPKHLVIS